MLDTDFKYILRRSRRQNPHRYDPKEMCKKPPTWMGEILRAVKLCVMAPESALYPGPRTAKLRTKLRKLEKITSFSYLEHNRRGLGLFVKLSFLPFPGVIVHFRTIF